MICIFLATETAANNNNSGVIQIKGVVPGQWEMTVSDINDGYDFNLSDTDVSTARIGTIHIYSHGYTYHGPFGRHGAGAHNNLVENVMGPMGPMVPGLEFNIEV